jgi:hypothetical protein
VLETGKGCKRFAPLSPCQKNQILTLRGNKETSAEKNGRKIGLHRHSEESKEVRLTI